MIETAEYVAFYSTRDVFSNFHRACFRLEGHEFSSSEQCFMFLKARLFGDEEMAASILEARTPAEAKKLGRRVRGFDEVTWHRERLPLMVAANTAKFSSSPELRAALLATAPKRLVEASKSDRIWGIGLGVDDPRVFDPSAWKGSNLLGVALEQVRDSLR